MLTLQSVVKHYHETDEEVRAVDGVNLTISPGEMVALHGPSGSGKTTLLLLIAALLKPDAGTIHYAGRSIPDLTDVQASEYLLHDVGFIFQGFHLMPRVSAIENASRKLLMQGVGIRAARDRAAPWLAQLGLGDRLQHTPEQLSGGERQRVAIAKVLACEPKLILADEPTGNLDSERSLAVVELLSSVAHGHGAIVVLVTHDETVSAIADRSITLHDGKLTGQRRRSEQAPSLPLQRDPA